MEGGAGGQPPGRAPFGNDLEHLTRERVEAAMADPSLGAQAAWILDAHKYRHLGPSDELDDAMDAADLALPAPDLSDPQTQRHTDDFLNQFARAYGEVIVGPILARQAESAAAAARGEMSEDDYALQFAFQRFPGMEAALETARAQAAATAAAAGPEPEGPEPEAGADEDGEDYECSSGGEEEEKEEEEEEGVVIVPDPLRDGHALPEELTDDYLSRHMPDSDLEPEEYRDVGPLATATGGAAPTGTLAAFEMGEMLRAAAAQTRDE